MNKELFEAIKKVLPIVPLNLREHKVLEHRFGLIDNNTHTLEDTGNLFGVTRERIRQIEAKALEKLKEGGWIDKSLWG